MSASVRFRGRCRLDTKKGNAYPEDAAKAQYATAALYDSYSALLLYSGSCTQAVYADVIRARLKARHPAFSGTWARDYEHVLGLSRQLTAPTTTFNRAVRFDRHVHMAGV